MLHRRLGLAALVALSLLVCAPAFAQDSQPPQAAPQAPQAQEAPAPDAGEPAPGDDPNKDALLAIIADLKAARDINGKKLEIVTVPSPGAITDEDGEIGRAHV